MKRSMKRSNRTETKLDSTKRVLHSGSSDSTHYTRRCMSTELLQLLCLRRSFLDLVDGASSKRETSPPRKSSKHGRSSPNSKKLCVNISTWSLSPKVDLLDKADTMDKESKENEYFLDFVNLYTKVKNFQSRNHRAEPEHENQKSVSLPSVEELPSFTHLLSKLASYFSDDIKEVYETNDTHEDFEEVDSSHKFNNFLSLQIPQDTRFGPIIPNNLCGNVVRKKSSLTDFLSRITRNVRLGDERCCRNIEKPDFAARLQANSPKRLKSKTTFPKNRKKSPRMKQKYGENSRSRKIMRVRSSKSNCENSHVDQTTVDRAIEHKKEKSSVFDAIKDDSKEQKKLLDLFQELFKKHKARERMVVTSKLPKGRTLHSNRRKSKKNNSNKRIKFKKQVRIQSHLLSPIRNLTNETPLQKVDSLILYTKNIEQQKSTFVNTLQISALPKDVYQRPVPPPRKTKVEKATDAEPIKSETLQKGLMECSDMTWETTNIQFHSGDKGAGVSSPIPLFQLDEKEEKRSDDDFKDGSMSHSLTSPESTSCEKSSNKEKDSSVPFPFNKNSFIDHHFCNSNDESSIGEIFCSDIMNKLWASSSRKKIETSKSKLIPGPFNASLTNLLKEKLPDVRLDGSSNLRSSSIHSYMTPSTSSSLPSVFNRSLFSNKIDRHSKISSNADKYSIFHLNPGRKDSIMDEHSLCSILTLKETLGSKYTLTGFASSELLFDKGYFFEKQLASSSREPETNRCSLKNFKSAFQDYQTGSLAEVILPETLISHTTIKDEASIQAGVSKPSLVSVCIQTSSDMFDKCVASTSTDKLSTRSNSSSSTLVVIKQLTKLHKLVSVPLNNSPLIAQSLSQKSRDTSSKDKRILRTVSHRTTLNKALTKRERTSPSPTDETFKTKCNQENVLFEKSEETTKKTDGSKSKVSNNTFLRNVILFNEKSVTSPKLRRHRSKKQSAKTTSTQVKYFENRNRNVSFRNSRNINQNFSEDSYYVEYNTNTNRKVEKDDESSSTDGDVTDRLKVIDKWQSPEHEVLNANNTFSRFMNDGKFTEALEITFDKDFSVDWEDPWSGERALVCAVVKSQHDVAARLLNLGSILDAPDYNGRTAFLASAIQVDHRSAWLLLSHGLEIFCAAPLKVAHGRSKNIIQFAKFLELAILSGYRPGKEIKWFETVLKNNSLNDEKDKELIEATQNLLLSCKQPASLSMLCFVSTRRYLSKANKGRSIVSSLKELHLPWMLRRFLCMEDVM